MRGPLFLLFGLMGVACTCGSWGDGGSDGGCAGDLTPTDGGGYGGYGGSGGYKGYGGNGGFGGYPFDAGACLPLDGTSRALIDAACEPVGCLFGHADCNGSLMADGCEVTLASDPNHCGMCDNSCGGGTCDYASCEGPELVGPSYFGEVTAMALDPQEALYYATVGSTSGVFFVPPIGTTPVSIVSTSAAIMELAVVDDRLVTLSAAGVDVYDLANSGALQDSFLPGGDPEALAVDGSWIYVSATQDNSTVVDAGLDGSAGQAGDSSPFDASDEEAEAASEAGSQYEGLVVRAPLAGTAGQPVQILWTAGGHARALARAGTTLYAAYSAPGRVYSIATDTLSVSELSSGDFDSSRIAVDGGFVYIADQSANRILRLAETGGAVESVATLFEKPFDVRADSGMIWFTTSDPGELYESDLVTPLFLAGLLRPDTPILVGPSYIYWSMSGVGVLRLPR